MLPKIKSLYLILSSSVTTIHVYVGEDYIEYVIIAEAHVGLVS